jgi:hypothetical protein
VHRCSRSTGGLVSIHCGKPSNPLTTGRHLPELGSRLDNRQRSRSRLHATKTYCLLHLQNYNIHFLVLLTNLTGTSTTPNVRAIFASRTRSRHCSFVSPTCKRGSTLKSRRRKVRKQTDSREANLRPMQARGPKRNKTFF